MLLMIALLPSSSSAGSQRFAGQGLYESCSPAKKMFCLERLQQMAEAGFTLVVNYDQLYAAADEELAYAQKAYELGMKIIWDMDAPAFWDAGDLLHLYSSLAATCHCSNDAGFISYFIDLVKDLPATWGYYIGDEVPVHAQARLQAFSSYVKELDPAHPRLIIQGAASVETVKTNLIPFAGAADVLGVDFYPVGSSGVSIAITGEIAHAVQTIAEQHKKRSAMVLQAFSWTQYPQETERCVPFPACANFPTESQMSEMFHLTRQNSPSTLILWYSYYNLMESDHPSQNWENLIQASDE